MVVSSNVQTFSDKRKTKFQTYTGNRPKVFWIFHFLPATNLYCITYMQPKQSHPMHFNIFLINIRNPFNSYIIYPAVVYIVRLQVPVKMRRWNLTVNQRFRSIPSLTKFALAWTCKIGDEAPPTHFHGHFKAHDIHYSLLCVNEFKSVLSTTWFWWKDNIMQFNFMLAFR